MPSSFSAETGIVMLKDNIIININNNEFFIVKTP